jgi:hypothetical protein
MTESIHNNMNRLDEKSPAGWKGTIEAMKEKHSDKFDEKSKGKKGEKLNPFAIANSMKKKGAKPHYKDKKGKPEKKEEFKEFQSFSEWIAERE